MSKLYHFLMTTEIQEMCHAFFFLTRTPGLLTVFGLGKEVLILFLVVRCTIALSPSSAVVVILGAGILRVL